MIEHLFSMIRREVVRTVRHFHKPPRMGLISQYDKEKHAVKVKFQPEGTLSGWIPLTALASGNQFGVMTAPHVNDQVEVHFQEGSHMVARVMTRHFSKVDKPPQLEEGEYALIHQSGSTIHHKKDGTLIIGGPGYNQTGKVGGGRSGNDSTGDQTGETGQENPQQQQSQPNGKQVITLKPNGDIEIDATPNGQGKIKIKSSVEIDLIAPKTNVKSSDNATVKPVAHCDGSCSSVLFAE